MEQCHYVYRINNPSTGEYYIGKRTCSGPIEEDSYMGSGLRLKRAMKARAEDGWFKEILISCESEEEAYDLEEAAVGDRWETDPLCLNLASGGTGLSSQDMISNWQRPAYRDSVCKAVKAYSNQPRVKQRRSDHLKEEWSDSEKRLARSSAISLSKPCYMCRDSLVVGVADKSKIKDRLRDGWRFTTKEVWLHNDSLKLCVYAYAKTTALNLLLICDGWDFGRNSAYRRVGVKYLRKQGIII